jgi:asparagine synthase (glutamine-hydrolysing)
MCGFVAIIGDSQAVVDREALTVATNLIKHRGPDDEAYFVDKNVGLGFRRLSILDLTTHSRQPFEDTDGRYVIVYNGEIYNYIEIREELTSKGHVFRSTGDTEVLLTAYKEWGESCVDRLNGMWAFLIFDKVHRSVFGSRDRFGVKPLFMYEGGGRYIFASEIKAIQSIESECRGLNWSVVAQYLVDDRLSEPDSSCETMFKNVREVPAGSTFTLDPKNVMKLRRFWQAEDFGLASQQDPKDEFDRLFRDAVRLRLRSDVPVGVCLSGGLDSTSIICHMADALGDVRSEPLRAFSYTDEHFDEIKQIEATVEATRAELYRLQSDDVLFLDKLEQVIWYQDEPIHSLNAVVGFELYRMASSAGVKVILNGQGADETWAGYGSYFLNYWYGLARSGQLQKLWQELGDYVDVNEGNRLDLLMPVLRTLFRNQLRRSRSYRSLAASRAHRRVAADSWFTQELYDVYPKDVPGFRELDLQSELSRSVSTDPLPLYLRIEDRNSMAHSIETRLPFLDYRLVELGIQTGPEWKIRGPWNKYSLRNAMKGVLPEIVRSRVDKMGFPVSAREWFSGPLNRLVRDTLTQRNSPASELFDTRAVLRDLEQHAQGLADHSSRLLRIMQVQLVASR